MRLCTNGNAHVLNRVGACILSGREESRKFNHAMHLCNGLESGKGSDFMISRRLSGRWTIPKANEDTQERRGLWTEAIDCWGAIIALHIPRRAS